MPSKSFFVYFCRVIINDIINDRTTKMVSKEQKKKHIKILRLFRKMIANGNGKMESYQKLAVKFKMSVSGIQHAILRAELYNVPKKTVEDDLPW